MLPWERRAKETKYPLPVDFESEDYTLGRVIASLELFLKSGSAYNHFFDSLVACLRGEERCRRAFCFHCASEYRKASFFDAMAMAGANLSSSRILTILIKRVPFGGLCTVDIADIRAHLRTVLDRSGFQGTPMCGGIEAKPDLVGQCWVVHTHLAVVNPPSTALNRLRRHCKRMYGRRAVKSQPIDDASKQLSYLLKFVTYHYPVRQGGSRLSLRVRMPPQLELELVSWWAGHELPDFQFLYGVRRIGGCLTNTSSRSQPTTSATGQ